MIKLEYLKKGVKLPKVDYVLDKPEKLSDLISNLTPKFQGTWEIILLDPKITQVNEILELDDVPKWIDGYIYVNNAKMEQILLDFPKYQPKEVSVRDAYKSMIADLKHGIDVKAADYLFEAVGRRVEDLQDALIKLDNECEQQNITLKQVQGSFQHTKRVYASEVLEAFMTHDRYRWYKFDKLTHDLGDKITYYALKKQIRLLLQNKNKYLHNEDVKSRIVEKVDAPFICYVYVLFANSNNYLDLRGILCAIENRSAENLAAIQD